MTTNKCSTSSCPHFLSIFNVAPQGSRSLFTSKMARSRFTPNDYTEHFQLFTQHIDFDKNRYPDEKSIDIPFHLSTQQKNKKFTG